LVDVLVLAAAVAATTFTTPTTGRTVDIVSLKENVEKKIKINITETIIGKKKYTCNHFVCLQIVS
jgi:hypothetical protein